MTELNTAETKPADAAAQEHKRNRKEVIALGFQNKTKGEALFNGISYVGFGYFVVTGVSVLMTYLMHDSKTPFVRLGSWLKEASTKAKLPPSFGNIGSLFIGGTIASVLPVKWFEDHKPEFVKKFDRFLYSDEQYHNDPQIIQAHKELDELPKQTWGSVLGSRVVAFAATLAVFLAAGSNKSLLYKLTEKWGGLSMDKASVIAGRRIDRFFNPKAAEEIEHVIVNNKRRIALPENHADHMIDIDIIRGASGQERQLGEDRKASRVFSYISLDAIYTLVTSITLWASTRVFGALVGKDAKTAAEEEARRHQKKGHTEHSKPYSTTPSHADNDIQTATTDTPPTRITSPTHLERVVEPSRQAELTA